MKTAIKEAIVAKVPTLKDKELKLNADLSKKSVTVSAKGFEGEVTLKFEIETNSKINDEMNEKINRIWQERKKLRYITEERKTNSKNFIMVYKIESYLSVRWWSNTS
ncbi:hypothetical protein HYE35_03990 [Mycoplasmopsis bovis]|nr:hypothetical protein [Mycoplasmopsis bovis]QQH21765.1 hypothetical protein HYE35_03990 [Mycoplasmopsis bovis]